MRKLIRKTLKSKIVHKNPWFSVQKDSVLKPNGKKGEYYFTKTPPSVFIVPITPDNQTFLVGQERYPIKQFSWELPAGGSQGENPLKIAKKELSEETGLKAKKWTLAGKFQNLNGMSNETTYVYIAQQLRQTGENKQAEDFITEMKKLPISKVWQFINSGKINDGQTIAALTLVCLKLNIKF
jgi:8-oxo-dGTP pyrophosphatase MutT (NUDIX family)